MKDITQAATASTVVFSANSPRADVWMRAQIGDHTVHFALPEDADGAAEFRRSALEVGLTIEVL